MAHSQAFHDYLINGGDVQAFAKGGATQDDINALVQARAAALKNAKKHGIDLAEVAKPHEAKIKVLSEVATERKAFFEAAEAPLKSLDAAIAQLGEGPGTSLSTAQKGLTEAKAQAESFLEKVKALSESDQMKLLGVDKKENLKAAFDKTVSEIESVVQKSGEALGKIADPGTDPAKITEARSAAKGLAETAKASLKSTHTQAGKFYTEATSTLENKLNAMRDALTGKSGYKRATGEVYSGLPTDRKRAVANGTPVYKTVSLHQDISAHTQKASELFDKIADHEKLAKNTTKFPHIGGAKAAATAAGIAGAAAAGDSLFGQFSASKEAHGVVGGAWDATKKTFAGTWKDNKIGFAGKTVVSIGGAYGLADAIFRSKTRDDQGNETDRGWTARVGEGAVGAAALAAALVGGKARVAI